MHKYLVMVCGSLTMTLSAMERVCRELMRIASGISLKLLLDKSASRSSSIAISLNSFKLGFYEVRLMRRIYHPGAQLVDWHVAEGT